MSEEEDKQAAWEFEACYPIDPHGDLRYEAKAMRAAFLAGIEHERKRLLGDQKPDGWIAYSARHGYDKMSFRAKESLVAEHMSDTKLAPDLHPLDMGWQIKPVKLVVVDETGGE